MNLSGWPMISEKLEALEKMVQEQLNAGHIEEFTSPWNSVFVIKKKYGNGEWRMLTDLRAINKVIQPMGSLQPGMPLLCLIPKEWPIIVIDLKYCFFTMSFQERNKKILPSRCLLTIILSCSRDINGRSCHREC